MRKPKSLWFWSQSFQRAADQAVNLMIPARNIGYRAPASVDKLPSILRRCQYCLDRIYKALHASTIWAHPDGDDRPIRTDMNNAASIASYIGFVLSTYEQESHRLPEHGRWLQQHRHNIHF